MRAPTGRRKGLDAEGENAGRGVLGEGGNQDRSAGNNCGGRNLDNSGGYGRHERLRAAIAGLDEMLHSLGLAAGGCRLRMRAAVVRRPMGLPGQQHLRAGEAVSKEEGRDHQQHRQRDGKGPHPDYSLSESQLAVVGRVRVAVWVIANRSITGAFWAFCPKTAFYLKISPYYSITGDSLFGQLAQNRVLIACQNWSFGPTVELTDDRNRSSVPP